MKFKDKKDEVLDEIANYIIPNFTFNGEKYVPLQNVIYLRNLAREAIKETIKDKDK